MRAGRRGLIIAGCLMALALLVGCGATGGGGLYGDSTTPTPAPTPTSGAGGTSVVGTATVTVKGQQELALTDTRGYTLYYFDSDTPTTVACTGSCAQTWPPLNVAVATVPPPAGVTGTFGVVHSANGDQAAYNGHPLYTYAGDTGPGQANGDGVQGKWHVATPATPVNKSGTGGAGGGYGY